MYRLSQIVLIPVVFALGASCTPDYEVHQQTRRLVTEPLYEAGNVAVYAERSVNVQLRSEGSGNLTITDIQLENEAGSTAFQLGEWASEAGTLELDGGSEYMPTVKNVEVTFAPEVKGYYRAEMTITSDDTEVQDGIWKVGLRGNAMEPCGYLIPDYLDMGPGNTGGWYEETVHVGNCGVVMLTIDSIEFSNDNFSVDTQPPIYVTPGTTEPVEIAWQPDDQNNDSATLSMQTDDPDTALSLTVIGNNCSKSVNTDWDYDGDGWFECGGDCNDNDADVHPGATETSNGQDDDCDGNTDEGQNSASSDADGDGYTENEGDCDDENASVYPGASESRDQIDEDCDGLVDNNTSWYDDDGDGLAEREGDCDDADDSIYPGAEEKLDGEDNDCDDIIDEGGESIDDDEDGFTDTEGDCDDWDPWVYPGAVEDCDGDDNDCDGEIDEDDACAYLVERVVDTGEEESSGGCSAVGTRGAWAPLVGAAWLLALFGLARRDEVAD